MIERITPQEYEKRQISDLPAPEAWLDKELKEQAEERAYIYGDPPGKPEEKKPRVQPIPAPQPCITGTIPFSEFGKTEDSQTVNPGESAIIYHYQVPPAYVAFLWELALRWWANTYWIWQIDGETVQKVERTIGNINEPYKMTPRPYKAEDEIKLIAYNNDSVAHEFKAVCDGELVRKIT